SQVLDRLPERYRQAVTLFYMEDKSYEQTAESLSLPLGTVKALLHRARKRLIELTREKEPEEHHDSLRSRSRGERPAARLARRRSSGRRTHRCRSARGRLRRMQGAARAAEDAGCIARCRAPSLGPRRVVRCAPLRANLLRR